MINRARSLPGQREVFRPHESREEMREFKTQIRAMDRKGCLTGSMKAEELCDSLQSLNMMMRGSDTAAAAEAQGGQARAAASLTALEKGVNAPLVKFAIGLATLLACTTVQAVPLAEALKTTSLLCRLSGDGRSQLTLQVENRSDAKESVEIAAGTIAVGKSGASMVALREAKVEIDPGRSVEAALPAVALSAANAPTPEPYELAAEKGPELQPLFDYSATHNDLPRATAQVCALLLHGDVAYPAWLGFLRQEKSAEARPTPSDIVAGVDGLALAKQFQPKREFAFAQDADFRLRAVRNPLSRAKAMQLFAMTLPDGAVAPDLGQLLHTKPGDNCPICRMRAQAAGQAGNGL